MPAGMSARRSSPHWPKVASVPGAIATSCGVGTEQLMSSDESPVQLAPPQVGSGLVQVRVHDLVPLPHSLQLGSQLHSVQPPWTGWPQSSMPPQPSGIWPHEPCAAHVVGVHVPDPQRYGVSLPHDCPAAHVPQSTIPPQPSMSFPHSAPRTSQVAGTHADW